MAITKAFASEIAIANPDFLFARVITGAMAKAFATAIFAATRPLRRSTSSRVFASEIAKASTMVIAK